MPPIRKRSGSHSYSSSSFKRPRLTLSAKPAHSSYKLKAKFSLGKKKKATVAKVASLQAKQIEGDDIHSGVGGKTVRVKLRRARARKFRKSAELFSYGVTEQKVQGTVGYQTVDILASIGSNDQWNGSSTTTNSAEYGGWFNMNPNTAITGSTTWNPSVATNLVNIDVMKHVMDTVTMHFTNITSCSQIHKLYVMECVQNSPFTGGDVLYVWQDGLQRQALGKAADVMPGPGVSSFGAAGFVRITDVDVTPMESRELRKFWRCLKVLTVYLAAGASEKITFNVMVNQTMTREESLKNGDAGINYIKGCYQILDVCTAQAIIDHTDGGANPVTIASAQYGVVTSIKTRLHSGTVQKRLPASIGIVGIPHGGTTRQVYADDTVGIETSAV